MIKYDLEIVWNISTLYTYTKQICKYLLLGRIKFTVKITIFYIYYYIFIIYYFIIYYFFYTNYLATNNIRRYLKRTKTQTYV